MPRLQAIALRIKDPKRSIPFYQTNFQMTLLHLYHFPTTQTSHYYLATLPPTISPPQECGSHESEAFLHSFPGTVLKLIHAWRSETEGFVANNGNVEPYRGFGHIAFNTPDVYEACTALEESGVKFQKKPDEGRMKGLAFVLDEDGYWIEIVQGAPHPGVYYNLSQAMIRIKDPQASLPFYRDFLGMRVVSEKHFEEAKFSLYFLAGEGQVPADLPETEEGGQTGNIPKQMFWPCLELTWNHGTESVEGPAYHDGTSVPEGADPKTVKGFAGLTFLVDDLAKYGANELSLIEGPTVQGIRDPDGYPVRLIGPEESLMHLHEDI